MLYRMESKSKVFVSYHKITLYTNCFQKFPSKLQEKNPHPYFTRCANTWLYWELVLEYFKRQSNGRWRCGSLGDIWQIMQNISWNCCFLWHWYFRACKDFHLDLRFNFRNILVYGPGNCHTFEHFFGGISHVSFLFFTFHICFFYFGGRHGGL